jgi:hypothetical protein
MHGYVRGVECPVCRADHGISPAQLREKVEALDLVLREAYRAIDALNTRVSALEQLEARLDAAINFNPK